MRRLSIARALTLFLTVTLLLVSGCSTEDDSVALPEPDRTENVPESEEPKDMGESEETEGNEQSDESQNPDGEEDNETQESEVTDEEETSDGGVQIEPRFEIFELIETTDGLSLFQEALAKADLASLLKEEDSLTVFAPTDAAVEQLFVLLVDEYDSFDDFSNPIEQQVLREMLLGHFIKGNLAFEDFEPGVLPTLLAEDFIKLVAEKGTYFIEDASEIPAHFVISDLKASNGTVHTIDKILIPQKLLDFIQ